MKGEKFYEMLDMLDDSLVLESAEVKRKVWGKRLKIVGIILAAVVAYWLVSTYPARHPPDSIGGEPGILQDEVYYAYAGSGFPIPGQVLVPQGIFRYVPGEGKELLVSRKEYQVDALFSDWSWGVNSHSLYFVDSATVTLWRMDLETQEKEELYRPDGAAPTEQSSSDWKGLMEEKDFWTVVRDLLTGELPAEVLTGATEETSGGDVILRLDNITEDTVWVSCYGAQELNMILDSRTGEVLSQQPADTETPEGEPILRTYVIGERVLEAVRMKHPEGFTYRNWEQEAEDGGYYWVDLRENGQSILPEGTHMSEEGGYWGGDDLLVHYGKRNQLTEEGDYDRWGSDYLLLTAEGETEFLPGEINGVEVTYLASAQGWAYYTGKDWENPDPAKRMAFLGARNLTTGETVLLKQPVGEYFEVITDGTWFYRCTGSQTNCYTIDHDAQGKPCGLTLVEEYI